MQEILLDVRWLFTNITSLHTHLDPCNDDFLNRVSLRLLNVRFYSESFHSIHIHKSTTGTIHNHGFCTFYSTPTNLPLKHSTIKVFTLFIRQFWITFIPNHFTMPTLFPLLPCNTTPSPLHLAILIELALILAGTMPNPPVSQNMPMQRDVLKVKVYFHTVPLHCISIRRTSHNKSETKLTYLALLDILKLTSYVFHYINFELRRLVISAIGQFVSIWICAGGFKWKSEYS